MGKGRRFASAALVLGALVIAGNADADINSGLQEGVRNFVCVSHTIPRYGEKETYGKEGQRAIQPGIA